MDFKTALSRSAEMTEKRLSSLLPYNPNGSDKLNDAIAYSTLGGGKRLRAYMVQEFCALCGGREEDALNYACAIEMIHAFSLIHDDLPAMDNDDMRRGKPSNHIKYGEATAILAGDSLALDAFGVICTSPACSHEQNERAVIALSRCSGSMGMCAGQQFDIDGEGKRSELDELIRLVDYKTGALFSCACALGCIAASATEEQIRAAEEFGLLSGRAFQITDDILDITSTPEELGKTVGKDIAQEKSTFVSLLGLDGARAYASECIEGAKRCLDAFECGESKGRLTEFCDYIAVRKK